MRIFPSIGALSVLSVSLPCTPLTVLAAEAQSPANLPDPVSFELGDSEFAPGDNITIDSVRGTQSTLALGQTYTVTGSYTLASRPEGELSLFITSTNPSASATPIEPSQTVRVRKGTGTFSLKKTLDEPGYPHLSFYPASGGSSFGGLYFGQGQSVLRNKHFSYFDSTGEASGAGARDLSAQKLASLQPENRRILEYLGAPVAPPVDLNQAYSKQGLVTALQSAAQKAGVNLKKIEIDDSEFPFLVGIISTEAEFAKVLEPLKKMEAYEHQGGVSTPSCRAINIIPWRIYPSQSAERIGRRLTVRERMFCDKLSRLEAQLR